MRRLALLLGMAAGLACGAAPATGATVPSLGVSGNRIVDTTTGRAFQPRGVNYPSYEYYCTFGYASVGYDGGHLTDDDLDTMADWHVNAVRIPLNEDCWLGTHGLPNAHDGHSAAGYRAAVDAAVARVQAHGLVAILDLHWTGADYRDADGSTRSAAADGMKFMPDENAPRFWADVAARYAADHGLILDAFNEPERDGYDAKGHRVYQTSWDCWRDGGAAACDGGVPVVDDGRPVTADRFVPVGMQRLVGAIRDAGSTAPIMLGGLDYARDFSGFLAHLPDDPAHALVADVHDYRATAFGLPGCSGDCLEHGDVGAIAKRMPVVFGELGEDDCRRDHDDAVIDWADAHGAGYLGWSWSLGTGVGPDDCGVYDLISDWGGTPRSPNGVALKSRLTADAVGDPTPPRLPRPAASEPTTSPAPPQAGSPPAVGGAPVPTPSTAAGRAHVRLVLAKPRRSGTRLRGSGRLGSVTGDVRITVSYRPRGTRRTLRRTTVAHAKAGRLAYAIALPRGATRLVVAARYAGSSRVEPVGARITA